MRCYFYWQCNKTQYERGLQDPESNYSEQSVLQWTLKRGVLRVWNMSWQEQKRWRCERYRSMALNTRMKCQENKKVRELRIQIVPPWETVHSGTRQAKFVPWAGIGCIFGNFMRFCEPESCVQSSYRIVGTRVTRVRSWDMQSSQQT